MVRRKKFNCGKKKNHLFGNELFARPSRTHSSPLDTKVEISSVKKEETVDLNENEKKIEFIAVL